MSRVQLLAPVHKALRWSGARVLIELGACAGDDEAVRRALAAVRGLLELHAAHQRIEDLHVIPAIEARKPGAARRLVEAHEDHETGIAELRERIDLVERDPSERALHALYLELTRFIADGFLHMYEEETLAEPLLAEIYAPDELAALAARARGAVTPVEGAAFAPAFAGALSLLERARVAKAG